MELSENRKLQFIEASYHTAPNLEPEKTDFVLNLMTQRFNDSKRSFSLLYTNHYTFDAMLIAGYMLELLAQMTKIREHRIEAEEIYGRAVYEKIQMMLMLPSKEDQSKWKKSFQIQIQILERIAPYVFKDGNDIFLTLKDDTLLPQEKYDRLPKQQSIFCHPGTIQKAVENFATHAKKILSSQKISIKDIESMIHIVYKFYCTHKHSNLLSFIEPEIDIASFVTILSIVEYYDYFGKLDYLLKNYEVLSEC